MAQTTQDDTSTAMASPLRTTISSLKVMPAWQYTALTGTLEASIQKVYIPMPTPGKDELLVKVHAAAINPADYKFPEIPYLGGLMIRRPAVPGMDFAGTIAESGSGFQAGDRVFGRLTPPRSQGSLAGYVVASTKCMARLPDNVDFIGGAAMGTAAVTAYESLVPLKVGPGSTVVINGASGGTGTFGVQIAKLLGARVVATCSGANAEMVKALGAERVIDYRTTDAVAEMRKLGPGSVDLVVDNVGETDGLHHGCDAFVKQEGRLVQIGGTVSIKSFCNMLSSMLLPVFLGGAKTKFELRGGKGDKPEEWKQLADWLEAGKIRPVIDSVFEFADAARAFEKLRTGRAKGKIVIKVQE